MAIVQNFSLKSKTAKNAFKAPNNRHHKQYKPKPSKEVEAPLNGQETALKEVAAAKGIQN